MDEIRVLFDPCFSLFASGIGLFAIREFVLCGQNQCAINNKCVTGCGDICEKGATTCETHTIANRGRA